MTVFLGRNTGICIKFNQFPIIVVCIIPNEILKLAGWPTLKALDVSIVDMVNLPQEATEATEVALAVEKISEPGVRREVTDAVLILLKKYFSE